MKRQYVIMRSEFATNIHSINCVFDATRLSLDIKSFFFLLFLCIYQFCQLRENPGKTPGKPRENPAKTPGKPWENPGETPGKPPENLGKTPGKPQENPGKTLGKPRENPGKALGKPRGNP